MSRLDELIKELCPDGVEYKPLGECCTILDRKRKPISKSARVEGPYPYYGANGIQDYVADYIFDGKYILVGEDGSVITETGNPVVNWAEGKIWVNNHAHIIEEADGVLLRYLYHYIQTIDITAFIHGNIPKFTGGDFKSVKIPVPPIEIQEEIVKTLDKFTDYVTELQARKQQFEYYREDLIYNSDYENCRVKIGDVCDVLTGGEAPKDCIKGDNADIEHPYAVWGNGKEVYGYSNSYRVDKDAVVISSIGANTGEVYYRPAFFTPIIRLKCVVPKDESIDNRYLFHALSATKIESKSSSVPNMNASEIKKLVIPLPNIHTQKRIANILDEFDGFCNDISEGLPAEIEARQKQYDYYRDKLLSFKEKEN